MRYYITIALLITLGGCATHHVPAESLALGRYNFSYVVEGGQPNSFTQVFDDGANTFLQLSLRFLPRDLSIQKCATKKTMRPVQVGQYQRITGIHDQLCIVLKEQKKRTSLKISRVTNQPSAGESAKYSRHRPLPDGEFQGAAVPKV